MTSHPTTASRFLTLALCALAVGLAGARGAETSAPAKEKARKTVTSAADLKKLIDEAGKQRDAMIADYETLKKQLAAATEEEKQAIRDKMEERKKAFDEMTNALHKQIRDEQRKQRAGAAKRQHFQA
jgi:transcriptional regulator of NAD metabolism